MASPGSSTVPIVSAHFCSLWEVISCESLSSIGMLFRRTEMLENVFWYVLTWALGNAAIARIWVSFASVRCIQPLRCAARMRYKVSRSNYRPCRALRHALHMRRAIKLLHT